MKIRSTMLGRSIWVISIGVILLSLAGNILWKDREVRDKAGAPNLVGMTPRRVGQPASRPSRLPGRSALTVLDSSPPGDARGSSFSWLIDKAKLDPHGALEYLDSLSDKQQRAETIAHITIGWAETDPTTCYEWVWSLGDFNEKSAGLVQFANTLSNLGRIDELIPFIERTPKGESRDDMMVFSMAGILKVDFEQGIRMIDGVSGKGALTAIGRTMATYLVAERSMGEATTIVGDLEHGAFRESLNASLVKEYISSSPEEGLRWFLANPLYSSDGKRQALSSVAAAFVSTSPQDGLSIGKSLADDFQKRFFSEKIGSGWVVADAGGAQAWMMQELIEGRYVENKFAINGIVSESLRIDNTGIFEIIDQVKNESVKRDLTRSAAIALAEFNPALAMEKLPDGLEPNSNADTRAVSEVMSQWLARDPLAATSWAAEMDRGRLRDAAVERVVEDIIRIDADVDAARKWVETISDSQVRLGLLKKLESLAD